MLGLTQSLRDSFSLAAWEAGFERDQAALNAYIMAETLIEATEPEAEIETVNASLRAAFQQGSVVEDASIDHVAALRVLDSFVASRLRAGSGDTAG
jgi:hypothetical protein